MSENYPSDVKLNENPNGTVSFATEVVATIAGLAATEVDGVASMISPASGLADMFSRKSNRNLTKGGHQFYLKSNFFDLLMGTTRVRDMIAKGKSADEIKATWQADVELFKAQRKPYLLYDE